MIAKKQEDKNLISEFDFLKNILGLHEERLLQNVLDLCKLLTIKKGEKLIVCGQSQTYIHLLVNGIFRGYFLDINGKDITDCLVVNPGTPLMPSSDLKAISPCTIEALANSVIFRLSISDFYILINRYPSIDNLYNKMLINSADYHRQLKIMMYQYNAEQRYHWFLKHYPDVLNKISHKYIASFLNMTPVTLSHLINSPTSYNRTDDLIELSAFPENFIENSRV